MGGGAEVDGADLASELPEGAGLVVGRRRLPVVGAVLQLDGIDLQVDGPGLGVYADDITVLDQGDRAAVLRFRADVPDAETAGRTGEAAVGDEGDVLHPLAVER